MERSDYLDRQAIRAQCDAAMQGLEKDNETLTGITEAINQFIDSNITSASFDGLKQQISDYRTLITKLSMANSFDIAEYATLKNSVGEGQVLNGNEIVVLRDSYWICKMEAEEEEDNYGRLAQEYSLYPSLYEYYRYFAYNAGQRANYYTNRYEEWKKKAEEYDSIAVGTYSLPTAGTDIRKAVVQAIYSVVDSYQNGTYIPDMAAGWRTEIEELSLGSLRKTLPAIMQNLANKTLDEMTAGEKEIYLGIVDLVIGGGFTDEEMTMIIASYFVEGDVLTSGKLMEGAAELAATIEGTLRVKGLLGELTKEIVQRGMVMIAALSTRNLYDVGKIRYDKETRTYVYEYTGGEFSSGNDVYYKSTGRRTIKVAETGFGIDAWDKIDRETDELLGNMFEFSIGDEAKTVINDTLRDRYIEKVTEGLTKAGTTVVKGATITGDVIADLIETNETAERVKNLIEQDDGGKAFHYLDLFCSSAIDEGDYDIRVYPTDTTPLLIESFNKYLTEENKFTMDDIYKNPEKVKNSLDSIDHAKREKIKQNVE